MFTKTEPRSIFNTDQKQVLKEAALAIRAINHKLRLEILAALREFERMSVTEIYCHFRLKQTIASQHLAILRRAKLVTTQRDGKYIYYSVNMEAVDHILSSCVEVLALNQHPKRVN